MYAIADTVRRWLEQGRPVSVAQVVATVGFSSRDQGSALAWTPGEQPVGALLEGVPLAPPATVGLSRTTVTDDDATAVGLSCGGVATVLSVPADAYPLELWDRLADREPVCIVTEVRADGVGTEVFTPETIRGAHTHADEIPRLFARGTSATALYGGGDEVETVTGTAVASLWPVPSLLVVGDGLIATALTDTAALLGWRAQVAADVEPAVTALRELRRSDAFVVLSHDREVDGPVLAAALASGVGYVGALGSRRTQAARQEWLAEHGVTQTAVERIHGPAGLDIDAHTPAEIAISIVAEILGSRTSSAGGALRDRPGPVHVAGVQSPPPRY